MRTAVIMPRLGESVTEGTVVRWRKQIGDRVETGEPLLEVSTDKVDTEVMSPATGVLLEIKVPAETTVEIGVELGAVGEASEASEASTATTRPRATPVVRKLAREHGVDLAIVSGSGDRGRIRQSDVLAAAASPLPTPIAVTTTASRVVARPPPTGGRTEPMSRTRQVIASRLLESLQTTAQLTTVVEVDLTRVARLRDLAKKDFLAREGVKLSFLPFFALAAIEALKAHPIVNASLDGPAKTITHPSGQHLGIAVDTDRGLLVPVIRDAGDLNLAGIARKVADLAERARAATIGSDELGGGTFTLTNTGSRGALFDTPIVNRPQSAILGTGAVVKRAVVVTDPALGDVIVPRSMAFLALSYDHRIIDGADAARFLVTIKDRLEIGNFKDELRLA